jgi:hypothetical protein
MDEEKINYLVVGKEYTIQEVLNFLSDQQNSVLIETKPDIDFF